LCAELWDKLLTNLYIKYTVAVDLKPFVTGLELNQGLLGDRPVTDGLRSSVCVICG
jgi:hypothetical protein